MVNEKKQKYKSNVDNLKTKSLKNNYTKIVVRSICMWMIIFIPIHVFYEAYTFNLKFYCGGGVYVCDEILYNILYSTILVIILLLIPEKIRNKNIFIIIYSLIYFVNYVNRCYQIAWEGQILHGNTWEITEIYVAFLHHNILFYLIGLIGLVLFVIALYKGKSIKKTKSTES